MYENKAVFFDSQVDAAWASEEYGPGELAKLGRLFNVLGSITGSAVLEPGCGTGRLTEILSGRTGPTGSVVAMDISPAMIEAARIRTAGCSNVEVHSKRVEEFLDGNSKFDLVLCHQVFPHLENKEEILISMARALHPEGKLVIFHFINLSEINDVHRKAGTVIENDMMPGIPEMKRLCSSAGLGIELFRNDESGFLLCARSLCR